MVFGSTVTRRRRAFALALFYFAYLVGFLILLFILNGHARDQGLEQSSWVLVALGLHFVAVTSIVVAAATCLRRGYRLVELADRAFPSNWVPGWLIHSQPRARVLLVAAFCVLSVGLYARSVVGPWLSDDDLVLLSVNRTWDDVQANLWVSRAGQILPPVRLTTLVLVRAADCPSCIARAFALHGVAFLLLVALLLYTFVRRELGEFYGLAAMAFFAVSSTYHEAIWRFTASLVLPATAITLVALLAAQRWRQRGRNRDLAACMLWCAIAPLWFASGVFAAPLCSLYLCAPQHPQDRLLGGWTRRRLLTTALPIVSASWFVIVSLLVASQNQDPFDPLSGLAWTVRSVVDNLVPGFTGLTAMFGLALPWPISFAAFGALAAAAVWWWRRAPAKGLLLVGLGAIFLGYWVVYSARAMHGYQRMTGLDWSRYHLLPQLGLTLFLAGGLPHWRDLLGIPRDGALVRQNVRWLLVGVVLLFMLQAPRPVLSLWSLGTSDKQMATLRRVEVFNRVCREQNISAATAREALQDHLLIEGFSNPAHAWLFLRCSETPRAWSVDEARAQLLAGQG